MCSIFAQERSPMLPSLEVESQVINQSTVQFMKNGALFWNVAIQTPEKRNPKRLTQKPKEKRKNQNPNPKAKNAKTRNNKSKKPSSKPKTQHLESKPQNAKRETGTGLAPLRGMCLELQARRSAGTVPPTPYTRNTHHSTLNTQHSTLNTQHSTLNTQHSTLST